MRRVPWIERFFRGEDQDRHHSERPEELSSRIMYRRQQYRSTRCATRCIAKLLSIDPGGSATVRQPSMMELKLLLRSPRSLATIRKIDQNGDTFLHRLLQLLQKQFSPMDLTAGKTVGVCFRLLVPLYPEALLMRNSQGSLPLHTAVMNFPNNSSAVSEVLKHYDNNALLLPDFLHNIPLHLALQTTTSAYSSGGSGHAILNLLSGASATQNCSCEEILAHRGRHGMLALHWACCDRSWKFQKDHVVKIIQTLILWYPQALSVQDDFGRLPLHVALESEAPDEVVRLLLIKMDVALFEVEDIEGRLPLHVALDMWSTERWMQRKQLRRLERLLLAYPGAACRPDGQGRLPIQLALGRQCPLDLVEALLNQAPRTIAATTCKGLVLWEMAALANTSLDNLFYLLQRDPGLFVAGRWEEDGLRGLSY